MLALTTTPQRFAVSLCLGLFSSLAIAATPAEIESMLEQGQNQQALSEANASLANDIADASVRFYRGVALSRLGKTNEAIDVFGALTREHPDVPEYANNLAVLYARNGEYEKARRWLEAAMSTHPAYATAHRNLGDVYTALAAVAYSKALDQQGQSSDLGVQLELVPKLYDGPGQATAIAQAPTEAAPATRIVDAPAPQPEPAYAPGSSEPQLQPESKPGKESRSVAQSSSQASGEASGQTDSQIDAALAQDAPVAKRPQPATAPAPQPTAATETGESTPENLETLQPKILKAVVNWASNWANQNVQAYLGSYASSFDPGDGQSLAQWQATRRDRVTSPQSIRVEVLQPQVELLSSGRAQVVFLQAYDADSYSDRVQKTLLLERNSANQWKIVRETSDPL